MFVPALGPALAQSQRPAIAIAPMAPVASATSVVQVPFLIRVGPPGAVPRGSFVRVRGLPAAIGLSEGHSIGPGAWAIPLASLPNLKMTLPAASTGRSEVAIALVVKDGSVLAEATYVLVVSPPPSADVVKAAPHRAVPLSPVQPPAPPIAAEDRRRALRLVKKGDEQLAEGGIAQARLLYERAAEAGLAEGAMALAATYDPVELNRIGVAGLKADRQAARKWYERARQLGAREAGQRLQRLGAE